MNTTDTAITIADELEQALTAKGVTDAVIQSLMDRALPHAKPIETPEQFEAAEVARKEIKKVRLIGEKGIDAVDRRYLDLRQASLAKKKELLEKINEPELLIEVHTKAWTKKKADEEAERQRLILQMQEQRKADLMTLGFIFVPGPPEHRYTLGSASWTAREIIEADHEVWVNMYTSARMVSEEIQAAKEEQERKEQEERDRIAAEQEALLQQQAEMARREAEMKAKEAAMQKMVNEVRRGELLALGCEVDGHRAVVSSRGMWTFSLHIPDLYKFTDEQWVDEILAAKLAIEGRNLWQREREEEAARQTLINERVAKLKEAGWELGDGPNQSPGLWLDLPTEPAQDFLALDELADLESDRIERAIQHGQAELARRKEAQEQIIRQEAVKAHVAEQAKKMLEAEKARKKEGAFGEWTPEGQFALEDRTKYLVATDAGLVTVAQYDDLPFDVWQDCLNREIDGNSSGIEGRVTHIMPMPKHPNHE